MLRASEQSSGAEGPTVPPGADPLKPTNLCARCGFAANWPGLRAGTLSGAATGQLLEADPLSQEPLCARCGFAANWRGSAPDALTHGRGAGRLSSWPYQWARLCYNTLRSQEIRVGKKDAPW